MRTYKLHLIRHGTTAANLEGIYCGDTDIPLDDVGVSELSEFLDTAVYPYAEWVFSSPLRRAVQTAEILYPNVEIIEIENLREASFGEFEGKSMEELRDDIGFARWLAGDGDFLPEGAEPPEDFYNRCIAAAVSIIDMMMTAGVHSAAVITHASVIGNIISSLAYPKAPPYEWNAAPGSGYTLVADPTLFLREPVLEVVATIPKLTKEELYRDEDAEDPYANVDWESDDLDDLFK